MGEDIKLEELGKSIAELQRLLGEEKAAPAGEKKVKQTTVRVTDDLKEGWLYLARPENGSYTKEEVLKILYDNGVRTGYIMSNIIAMVKKGVYERSIKVAMYKECEQGTDGYYEYFIDIGEVDKKHPKINEDGSVDYASVNFFVSVENDQLLCKYHPAVQGTPGYYVDGTPIEPDKVADLPQIKGKGFVFDKATNEYRSTCDGRLDFKDTYEIQINKVLVINTDVNQLNPRIEFNGDIEILGNVESGCVIRSTHNITISGVVEAVQINAGGDVVLKRGIQGSGKAQIVCNGNVFADFVEHTIIRAKGDVNANSILNSEVYSDSKVILSGKRGALVGGYAHGRKGIQCVNLGNSVEVKTVAHVGLETKDYLKNQEILKKDAYLREQLKSVLDKMNHILIQKKVAKTTPEELAELNELQALKTQYTEELKDNEREEEIISVIVEEARDAEIRVEDNIYKGTIISVDASRMPIKHNTKFMIYKGHNGTIEGKVIVVN